MQPSVKTLERAQEAKQAKLNMCVWIASDTGVQVIWK